MGNNKQPADKSRRDFFSSLLSKKENAPKEKVKMLTPDGKLVEVDKAVLDQIAKKKKASNEDIYNWMDNPSK